MKSGVSWSVAPEASYQQFQLAPIGYVGKATLSQGGNQDPQSYKLAEEILAHLWLVGLCEKADC